MNMLEVSSGRSVENAAQEKSPRIEVGGFNPRLDLSGTMLPWAQTSMFRILLEYKLPTVLHVRGRAC